MERRKDNKGRVLKNGESQRGDGRYVYQYVDLFNKRRCVYSNDLNDLRRKEKEIESKLSLGICDCNMTLNQLFDESMVTRKRITETTRENYLQIWNYRIRNSIGMKRIGEIKRNHLQSFYNQLADEGLSYATIEKHNTVISMTFNIAVDNDLIVKNPCIRCLEDFVPENKSKNIMTRQQQEEFLSYIENSNIYSIYYPIFLFMLKTGVRCGEAIGLTWHDVDFRKRQITIDHQLLYRKHKGKYQFRAGEPKTESGIRIIPMTTELAQVMLELRKRSFEAGLKCSRVIDGYTDFVFLTKNKNPIMPSAVNNALLNIVNAYNKENPSRTIPHLSAHALRHTFCTRMAEDGMDIKVLQKIMGHNNFLTTMNIYNHVTGERLHEEAERVEHIVFTG